MVLMGQWLIMLLGAGLKSARLVPAKTEQGKHSHWPICCMEEIEQARSLDPIVA